MSRPILVADDNPGFADLVRATLEEAGYDVVTAATGLAAVAALQKHDVGLEASHHGDCLSAIAGLTDDRELGPCFLQAVDDMLAHQPFIVRNDGGGCRRGMHPVIVQSGWLGAIS